MQTVQLWRGLFYRVVWVLMQIGCYSLVIDSVSIISLTYALKFPMPKTINLSLASIFLVASLAGCEGEENTCDGIDLDPPRYSVLVTGVSNVTVSRELASGVIEALDSTDVVSIDQLHLRAELAYSRTLRVAQNQTWNPLDWFFSTANACSLKPYEGDIDSRVQSIDLISDESMGENFQSGASLSTGFGYEFVEIGGIDYGVFGPDPIAGTLAELSNPPTQTASLVYELRPSNIAGVEFLPEQTRQHQFTFAITLDTGEMFMGTSNLVQISGSSQ